MSSGKNIVILGASYGGVSTAHYLLKHAIPHLPTHRVVLGKLFVGIDKAFDQYPPNSFRFVHGKAISADHLDRTVSISLHSGNTENLPFHSLVIATGASTSSPLLSLNKDEHFLRDCWKSLRQALLTVQTIVVAGGGPAGIEVAGELGEHLNGRVGWFSSRPAPKVSIKVITSGSQILPLLWPSIAAKAEVYLSKLGVEVIKNIRVQSTTPADAGTEGNLTAPTTIHLSDGSSLEADLYIPATGMKPNTAFLSAELLTSDGQVETLSTFGAANAGPRIYGDVASHSRSAVHLTLEGVPILCANLKRDLLIIEGKSHLAPTEDRIYKEDKSETQLVPIGRSRGVGAAMDWQMPSWSVWLIKGRDYWLWTTAGLWSGKQWEKEK